MAEKNIGPRGQPVKVDTHDFPDPQKGKAIPYGVYDIAQNRSMGFSRDQHGHRGVRRRSDTPLVEATRTKTLPQTDTRSDHR